MGLQEVRGTERRDHNIQSPDYLHTGFSWYIAQLKTLPDLLVVSTAGG